MHEGTAYGMLCSIDQALQQARQVLAGTTDRPLQLLSALAVLFETSSVAALVRSDGELVLAEGGSAIAPFR